VTELGSLLRFPCKANKAPLMRGWQRRASRDSVDGWPLVGVPTGEANGFDVLDIDVEGLRWWEQHRDSVPRTQGHRTRSGGLHLLFRHAPGLRSSAGRIAAGVDVRAAGGFVIWWPQQGLPFEEHPLSDWPEWLLQLAVEHRQLKGPQERAAMSIPNVHGAMKTLSPRGRIAAIERTVGTMAQGNRNAVLNWAAYQFGGMIVERIVVRKVAEALLVQAAKANGLWRDDGEARCWATINSGIEAGIRDYGVGTLSCGPSHSRSHPHQQRFPKKRAAT
jgi:hypothetical protein